MHQNANLHRVFIVLFVIGYIVYNVGKFQIDCFKVEQNRRNGFTSGLLMKDLEKSKAPDNSPADKKDEPCQSKKPDTLDMFGVDRDTPSYRRPLSALPSNMVMPSPSRTLEAAMNQESIVGFLLKTLGEINTYKLIHFFWEKEPPHDDPKFDTWNMIAGTQYEDFAYEFGRARNKEDVLHIMTSIYKNLSDREALVDSGRWGTFNVFLSRSFDMVIFLIMLFLFKRTYDFSIKLRVRFYPISVQSEM